MLPAAVLAWSLVTMATVVRGQATEALYDSSVNFTCSSPIGPDGSGVDLGRFSAAELKLWWILPSQRLIQAGTSNTDNTRVMLHEGGTVLQVLEVDDVDFGWYHCLVYIPSQPLMLVQTFGLNVQGPFWGDLYDLKYKQMLTVGLAAGGVCLAVTAMLCFLYGRQQARLDTHDANEEGVEGAAGKGDQEKPKTSSQVHDNPVFTIQNENSSTGNEAAIDIRM